MGIGDASIVDAQAGKQNLKFAVTLSAKVSSQVTVAYTVTAGSATYSKQSTGGGHYGGKTTGTLTFNVGASGLTPNVQEINIPIWPDTHADSNETFTVSLSNLTGTGVSLLEATATGTVLAS